MKILESYIRIKERTKGQSALEFVMVIPFVIIIILAASQAGLTLYSRISLQQASREGARIISVTNDNRIAIETIKRICGKETEISIKPGEASRRRVGDMVTVYISKSPGGLLKAMENLIGREVVLKAEATMRMECDRSLR